MSMSVCACGGAAELVNLTRGNDTFTAGSGALTSSPLTTEEFAFTNKDYIVCELARSTHQGYFVK